jgi:hypothetical protein
LLSRIYSSQLACKVNLMPAGFGKFVVIECIRIRMLLQQVAKTNPAACGLDETHEVVTPLTPSGEEGFDWQSPFDE